MSDRILLSSAYFPPVHYLALVASAEKVFIEKEENYIKQTYRNRCNIVSSNGLLTLTVPVLLGSFHKTRIKDLRIDYSKRWQQLHLRGLSASYRSSPYFDYYFDLVEKVIITNNKFLLDLNMKSLETVVQILKIESRLLYTDIFEEIAGKDYDFRYDLIPKKVTSEELFTFHPYPQVFENKLGFTGRLSILDLIFNLGPESPALLNEILN